MKLPQLLNVLSRLLNQNRKSLLFLLLLVFIFLLGTGVVSYRATDGIVPQIHENNVRPFVVKMNPLYNPNKTQVKKPTESTDVGKVGRNVPETLVNPFIAKVNPFYKVMTQSVKQSSSNSEAYKNTGQSRILRWIDRRWRPLNNYCKGDFRFVKATLKAPSGETPIFVHNFEDDMAVSGALIRKGIWDPDNVNLVYKYLSTDPGMAFIDLGAHVGTFSLMAAMMGRQVAAVDPLQENVLRFCKSIESGKFEDRITVFFTALSDTYSQFTFQRDHANIGGTRLSKQPVHVGDNPHSGAIIDPNVINTVHLDDLLPVVNFTKAFIKMDVEEHELQVLKSGEQFFKIVDIPYILMEWFWHKKSTGRFGPSIIRWMVKRSYLPFSPSVDNEEALKIEDYRNWPIDVLWKKVYPTNQR